MTNEWNLKIYSIFKNDINNININNNIDINTTYGNIDRLDLTHLEIYSIDPPGCTDADDAFSIVIDEFIHLYIHIADPTSYFLPDSELFKYILDRGQTLYLYLPPHINKPFHLFPDEILEKCSLTHGIRNTITIHTILEPIFTEKQKFKIINSKIEFGIINAENHKRFSYEEASNNMFNDNKLLLGIEIAQDFWLNRKKTNNDGMNAFMFSDLFFTIPIVKERVIMKSDSKPIKVMKSMIAEFAIHANSIFASGLSQSNGDSIFRSINTKYTDLFDIIKHGDSAKYTNISLPHDILNIEHYTHATSPLRRASDCIVHFLLKSQYLNINNPFTVEQLKKMAEHLTQRNKYFKNIQFKEIKLRTFQWMYEELESNMKTINLKAKIITFTKPYLNILITNINDMDVNISYSLRRDKININDNEISVEISKVNLYNKFDENTLPELDNLFPL